MDTLTLAQATTRWGGSTVQGAMNNCKKLIHLRVTCGKSTQNLMVGWGAEMSARAWAGPTATAGSRRGRPPATRGRGGPSDSQRCTGHRGSLWRRLRLYDVIAAHAAINQAILMKALVSSQVDGVSKVPVRSTTDTSGVDKRTAMPGPPCSPCCPRTRGSRWRT